MITTRLHHPIETPAKWHLNSLIPSDTVLHILISDILLTLGILSGKHWLLARGVGSLWLSINVLAGGGLGALVYLVMKGRVAVRGPIPWKTLALASGSVFAQQMALFYGSKRLDASRILFVAPFSATIIRHIIRTHSLHSVALSLAAVTIAILTDANFSTADLYSTTTAYIGLIIHGGLQVASSYIMLHLSNSFETPQVSRAVTIISAAAWTLPIHLLGRTIGLLPPYPYVPILALTPLPLLAFVLLHYHPTVAAASASYSPQSTFKLAFIPTAVLTCILSPLFSRKLTLSDIPLATLFYFVLKPSSISGSAMSKSASEPLFRLFQGYLNAILSNPESRKIFYFLIVNLAYMLVQMLYGVWTNSLGLISDAIHMAFDCMAIGMGLFASVMATWKPNERFTYGYSRIETLSGFANGIFLILISVFIIVEAIQRLIDPPQMNTRQLLLVSTVGLAVNLFGMFAMGGHAHHGHSHSHGGHGHSHSGGDHATHNHESPKINDIHHGHSHDHDHVEEHVHSHGGHEEHSHSHSDTHGHSHDHGHDHGQDHGHNHETHAHSHSHSQLHNRSHSNTLLSPEIRLESPTDEKRMFFSDSPSMLSPIPPSPSVNSAVPFTPITPSYSFTYDDHLEKHHPETSHSHSHSSHEGHSHNMRGVFLHVMADTLGSVGVILSTILINIYGWTGFDPIASIFIAVLIAASVLPLVMDTGRVLALDLGGKEGEVERALQEVSGVYGVQSYSEAKFWPLEQGKIVGSIHVQIIPGVLTAPGTSGASSGEGGFSKLDRIREDVEHVLKSKITGLDELVIQLDG